MYFNLRKVMQSITDIEKFETYLTYESLFRNFYGLYNDFKLHQISCLIMLIVAKTIYRITHVEK